MPEQAKIFEDRGAKVVRAAKRIRHLLGHGWQTVAHVHTAWWLVVDVFRVAVPATALITGLITLWGEHSAAIVAIVFVITLTATVLLWLAGLGHQSTSSGTESARSALIWGPPPDWQTLRTIWWLWLAIGLTPGIGTAAFVWIWTRAPVSAPPPEMAAPAPVGPLEITWGDPSITFGMQKAGSDYLIKALEFHGKNTSGHGMYRMGSWITSDLNQTVIQLFVYNNAQWINFENLDAIPNDTNFIVGCPIRKDKPNCGWETEGMRPEQFLKTFGAFSVSFNAEGRPLTGLHFSIEELENKIREAEKLPIVERKD